ncbi:hypothetical protein AJ79_06354 [Helicocarpus griseus UAMH5409]|uniref:Uncharacterized protein n=1 Tax=Helicocarpus griseus UAMH5409 TaxID=1447875 RepID=A0A2B7XD59_9EURO|nr:hypothetical protein AJ79_06354 [Helicocarpus griseus UAMH5409]
MRAFTPLLAIPVVLAATLGVRDDGSVSISDEPFCPEGKWADECKAQQAASVLTERSLEARAESGSWCYKPGNEAFWGAASAACCDEVNGNMRSDRRCYGLKDSKDRCNRFYRCCVDKFSSGNRPGRDKCY